MKKQIRFKKQQDEVKVVFGALSHPARIEIIEFICSNGGKTTVEPIVKSLKISWSSVSKHLKILSEANLLVFEKHGNHRIFKLNRPLFRKLSSWFEKLLTY